MAAYPAIAATSEAILGVLKAAATDTPEFTSTTFKHTNAKDLQTPPTAGVTLWLHRIAVSSTRRNLPPRLEPDGTRYRPSLPLDLFYLVTAWPNDAPTQQRLLGWCIRALEDQPILPAGLLNHYGPEPDVFRPHETVELVAQSLTAQELSDVWEVNQKARQPSIAYLARAVEIDSRIALEEYGPVQTREFDYAEPLA